MCVYAFFTLTDRASAVPSKTVLSGRQSGARSTGQEKVRGTSTKLQREHMYIKKGYALKSDHKSRQKMITLCSSLQAVHLWSYCTY